MFELVKTLTELTGPTGYEDKVQDYLEERWAAPGRTFHRNGINNLLMHVGGTGKKLLIAAHSDEIGFRVKSITADGFVWLAAGGREGGRRAPEPVPLGHKAVVLGRQGPVEGTYCAVSGHVLTRAQKAEREGRGYDWQDFFVDLGMTDRVEVEAAGIHAGAPVITSAPTRQVGRHLVGKAFDDRAGLAAMTKALDQIDPDRLAFDVWFGSTVMEECALMGGRSAIGGFDLAVAIEVGLAGDVPGVDPDEMPVRLGKGPVLVHKDASTHYSAAVTAMLHRAAAAGGIAVQDAVFNNYNSDGFEWIREGVPSALLTFPCRYTHSPYETVDIDDLNGMADLLLAFVYGEGGS